MWHYSQHYSTYDFFKCKIKVLSYYTSNGNSAISPIIFKFYNSISIENIFKYLPIMSRALNL